jgi:hypothetical protein
MAISKTSTTIEMKSLTARTHTTKTVMMEELEEVNQNIEDECLSL